MLQSCQLYLRFDKYWDPTFPYVKHNLVDLIKTF